VAAARDENLNGAAREVEPLLVDVHQRDGAILQQWKGQDVTHEAAGEGQASRPDKDDLCHA